MRRLLLLFVGGFLLMCAVPAEAQYNKEYFNWRGRRYLSDSQYEQAIRTFNTLLRADPNAYETYFLRGVAKYSLGDLLGAETDFSAAIAKNPVYTYAYQNRAITRMRLGNYDDALRDFKEAIDLRPDLPGAYYIRGVTYLQTKQFKKAIDDFNEYIKRDHLNADVFLDRGEAYLNLRDTARAYEDFDRAVRTNREYPLSYFRRGTLYSMQKRYDEAVADFDKSIACDSAFYPAYWNRSIAYYDTNRPTEAIADLTRVTQIDSTNSQAYYNRAIMRTNIGDYNRALEDFDRAAQYAPGNVLIYYNRAALYARLGNYPAAAADFTKAIELYPDFANAYLARAQLRYTMRDMRGSRDDYDFAQRKIKEYKSRLRDTTFSDYADTSRKFDRLVSFDEKGTGEAFARNVAREHNIGMRPLFRFTLMSPDTSTLRRAALPYYLRELEGFVTEAGESGFKLVASNSDIAADSLLTLENRLKASESTDGWIKLMRAIVQSEIKQYTSAMNNYAEAIDASPSNAFLYFNRSSARSEMIDFISSIDNSYQHLAFDGSSSGRLGTAAPSRTYSYDEAIADLNKAAKLLPDFAHIYYNRANLLVASGRLPEAYEDYTRAIGLYPDFAEAYFNRGLVQIYMKDTRKGCLDISKAGELGIADAYTILKSYSYDDEQ